MSGTNRVFGIDLIRSIAIVLVLFAHSMDFFIIPHYIGKITLFSYPIGFLGVEIFFVLSGFLIGGIIINEIVERGSLGNLLYFYIRRWFRTLPLYYLVVLFLIIFPIHGKFSWENLLFLQNFTLSHLNFNPISWSLSIEEWFYFIIPLILLVTLKFSENKEKIFFTFCFFVIVFCFLFRLATVLGSYDIDFDFDLRKQVFLRLDSIMFGVVLAGIKYYSRNIYVHLINRSKLIFVIAIVGLIVCINLFALMSMEYRSSSIFICTFFFDIVSFLCVLLLVSLERLKTPGNTVYKMVNFLSKTSYSVYLIHFQVYKIVRNYISPQKLIEGVGCCIIAISMTLVISYVVHRYYEIPFMNLRERFNPNKLNFTTAKKAN